MDDSVREDELLDRLFKPELIKETLEESVPLASTFAELANLIRGMYRAFQAELTPPEKEAIFARIMVSANHLRSEIEHVVGPEQTEEFFDDLKDVVIYYARRERFTGWMRPFGCDSDKKIEMRGFILPTEASKYMSKRGFWTDIEILIKKLEQWDGRYPIEIEAREFNKGKTFDLLERIIQDTLREGVQCEYRTFRSLKENLKKHSEDSSNPGYLKLAKSLKWKEGKARTTLPAGLVTIIP